MYVYNRKDNDFKVGEEVLITNSLMATEKPYWGNIIQIVSNVVSGGLGVHYVLLVRNHIDDYLTIREAERCFRSEEQYNDLCDKAITAHKQMIKALTK